MKSLATLNKQSITTDINSQDKQATNETSSTLADICTFLNTHYTFQLEDTDQVTEATSETKQRLSECVAYLLRKNNEKIFIRLKPDASSGEQSEQTFKLNSSYICKKLIQQQQQQRQMKEQASKATNGNHTVDVKSPEATASVKEETSASTTPTKKESKKAAASENKQSRTPPSKEQASKKIAANSLSAAELDEETVCIVYFGITTKV